MQPECRLCGCADQLKRSHVLPEFLYRFVYDEKHRFEDVKFGPDPRVKLHQKGLREPLLCGACEQQLGRYETYASQLFFHRDDFQWVEIDGTLFISHVEYAQFKLFLLSLIWRAGVSSLPMFRGVDLGPHEARMQSMLQREDPGRPHEYPATLHFFRRHKDLLRGTIIPPQPARVESHRAYQAALVGWLFTFFVSRHIGASSTGKSFLREDGVLPVRPLAPSAEERLVRGIGKRLISEFPEDET